MESLNYRFTLDCGRIGVQRTIQGIQTGDVMSRRCVIGLTHGGRPVDLPSDGNLVAMMYVKKPDSLTPSINACEIDTDTSTVIYEISQEDIEQAGIVTMQIKIEQTKMNGVGTILVSPKFELEIEVSEIEDSAAEATETYTALEQAISRANAVYNSRLVSITSDEDYNLIVTYADGTTYETDAITEAVDAKWEETLVDITALNEEAYAQAEIATNKAEVATMQAEDAMASKEAAEESVVNAKLYADLSSAYATGYDTDGNFVPAPQPPFRNNAKFFADLAGKNVFDAEAWAKGTRGGVPVDESDPTYLNNAKHYSDNAAAIVGSEFLSYEVAQDLTEAQRLTARANIGAASSASVTALENAFQADLTALDEKVQEDISTVEGKAQEASEKATEVDSRVTELAETIPIVDQALNPYSENAIANKAVVDFTQLIIEKAQRNVTVATTAWHDDTTYEEYPYAAEIPYTGSTRITTYAEIVFSPSQVSSGIFAPVCESTMESIIIYASEIPSEDIVIPFVKVSAVGVWN